jgi:hypothetical protein
MCETQPFGKTGPYIYIRLLQPSKFIGEIKNIAMLQQSDPDFIYTAIRER